MGDIDIIKAIDERKVFFVEKPLLLHENKKAILLHALNPSLFSIQLLDEIDVENKIRLEKQLEEFVKTLDTKCRPKTLYKGMPVMVPNPIKPRMYSRAYLRAVYNKVGPQVNVECVDLGCSFVAHCDTLRMVTMELLRIPKLAYYCKLYQVESKGNKWPEIDWKPYLSGKETILIIKNRNEQHTYEVQMVVDSKNVTNCLVDELNLAKITPLDLIRNHRGPYPMCDFENRIHLKVPVFGLSLISAEKAWFQLNVEMAHYINRAVKIYNDCLTEEIRNKTFVKDVGFPCLAQCKKDGLCYRAVITKIKDSKTFEVLFVDFGNTELVKDSELIKLPHHLLNIPVAATKVVLADALRIKSAVEREKLKVLVESRDLVAKIHHLKLPIGQDRVVISLWLQDGTPLSDIFDVAMKEDFPLAFSVPTMCNQSFSECMIGGHCEYIPGTEYTGIVSYIESVKSVWVQLNDGDAKAEKISCELDQYYSRSDLMLSFKLLKKGYYCAVKKPSNSRWYRALISEVNASEKLVTVVFIDYGNNETVPVDFVKPLIPYFALQKSCAFQIALEVEEKPEVDPTECINAILNFVHNKRVSVKLYHKDDFYYACIKLSLAEVLRKKNSIKKLKFKDYSSMMKRFCFM